VIKRVNFWQELAKGMVGSPAYESVKAVYENIRHHDSPLVERLIRGAGGERGADDQAGKEVI